MCSLAANLKMPQSSGERNTKKRFGEKRSHTDRFEKSEKFSDKSKKEKKDQKSNFRPRSSKKDK